MQELGGPQPAALDPNENMLSHMLHEASSGPTDIQHGPLPDPVFIGDNQPVARPVAPTTASKAGKAALKKRKSACNTTGATKTTKKSKTKPKSGRKKT
ncbi:hypothetical protein BS78_03G166000 [Paspalum vaginatum]|nr:hypothetical protein BS78_03G166000 [Paspalum vaginatum]